MKWFADKISFFIEYFTEIQFPLNLEGLAKERLKENKQNDYIFLWENVKVFIQCSIPV